MKQLQSLLFCRLEAIDQNATYKSNSNYTGSEPMLAKLRKAGKTNRYVTFVNIFVYPPNIENFVNL